ncbi:MAG: hypothetical protein U5R49_16665 [Deltaproteobacteria bacterium]|nr:hypothetical protein [Deltaproteobacteria bacterium]
MKRKGFFESEIIGKISNKQDGFYAVIDQPVLYRCPATKEFWDRSLIIRIEDCFNIAFNHLVHFVSQFLSASGFNTKIKIQAKAKPFTALGFIPITSHNKAIRGHVCHERLLLPYKLYRHDFCEVKIRDDKMIVAFLRMRYSGNGLGCQRNCDHRIFGSIQETSIWRTKFRAGADVVEGFERSCDAGRAENGENLSTVSEGPPHSPFHDFKR